MRTRYQKTALIIALLIVSSFATAAAQWVNISESGRVYTGFAILNDVIVATNKGGSGEAVLTSGDLGQTWAVTTNGIDREGRAVVATETGFVVNNGGRSDFVSDAGGTAWTEVDGPGGNVTNFFYDPTSGRVWAGTQSVNLAYSDDGGVTWSYPLVSNRDNEFTWVHARGNTILAGYNQGGGRTYLSVDGGTNWTDVEMNASAAGFVAENGDLYVFGPQPTVSRSSPLMRSTDNGQTWNVVHEAPGLGGIFGGQWTPLRQKALIFVDGQSIMYAINARVYVSHDGGATFEDMSQGLVDPGAGDSAIKTMEIADGHIYVLVVDNDAEAPTQFGYGIYRRPATELGFVTNVASERIEIPDMDVRIWPNPVQSEAQIEIDADEAGAVHVRVFDMLGRQVVARDIGHLSAGMHRIDLETALLPPGVYAVRVEAGRRASTSTVTVVR